MPPRLKKCRFDGSDPLRHTSRLNGDKFKSEVAIRLFVDLLETQRILKTDAPRFGWGDNTKVADEKDLPLVGRLPLDSFQLVRKEW